MNDINRELRVILNQIPGMREAMRFYYRGLKGSMNDE